MIKVNDKENRFVRTRCDRISSNLWSKLPFSGSKSPGFIEWGHLIDYYLNGNPFLDAEREEEEILRCCEKVFSLKSIIIRKGSQTAFSSTHLEPKTESKGFRFSLLKGTA